MEQGSHIDYYISRLCTIQLHVYLIAVVLLEDHFAV